MHRKIVSSWIITKSNLFSYKTLIFKHIECKKVQNTKLEPTKSCTATLQIYVDPTALHPSWASCTLLSWSMRGFGSIQSLHSFKIKSLKNLHNLFIASTQLLHCCIRMVLNLKISKSLKKLRGLKVHKIEIFFGFAFEICILSLLVMWKY
jgi:hypothetical protein